MWIPFGDTLIRCGGRVADPWPAYFAALNKLTFIPSASNPTTIGGGEADFIMDADGVTCDQWVSLLPNGSPNIIYHRTANNALLDNWGAYTACTGVDGFFPKVFKIGTTYYMFIKPVRLTGDIYLYSSTDKIAWTVMNGGAAAITASADVSDWNNRLFNVSVAVIGTTVHILCEGSNNAISWPDPYHLGYATADISSPVFTLPVAATITNGSCNSLIYSATNNAFICLVGVAIGQYAKPLSKLKVLTGSLTSDLTLEASWTISSIEFPSLASMVAHPYPSDTSIYFTPGKTYPMMMYYCYGQATGFQGYGNLNNADELYDSLFVSFNASVEVATPTEVKITGGVVFDGASVPDVSAFTIPGKTITNISITGAVVTLTVSAPFVTGDVITLSYTKPATNPLKNSRTDIPSFVNFPVINNIILDADGNAYTYVKIGTQTWLIENLKTTKYNDASSIPTGLSDANWTAEDGSGGHDGAFAQVNNNAGNKATYGLLYNWFAVNNAKGIAPVGYHVATDAEYTILANYLAAKGYGYEYAGTDIGKSLAATTEWTANATPGNVGNDLLSNNAVGFNALPAGFRGGNGAYGSFETEIYLWSATESAPNAIYYNLASSSANFSTGATAKNAGVAVRCIKD